MVSVAAMAQRDCGFWLNDVPLVADTAGGCIYATLDPGVSTTLKGTLRWDANRYDTIKLNDVPLVNNLQGNMQVPHWSNDTTNHLTVINSENRRWRLVFSTLPFVVMDCPLSEMIQTYSITKGDPNHTVKFPGYISVIDARCRTKLADSDSVGMACFSSPIRTRLRGATSGSQAKKSFNVELVDGTESTDAHLLGYRKDDDWILSSEFTDYSRMRNRVLMDLWTSVDKLPYDTDNKYQCNGTSGEFVELFVNGGYYGLYCFTDKIDRKKLNLKKTKEATATTPEVLRGLLWKANWECSETYLGGYDSLPANDSFLWPYKANKNTYGWEQKYPDDTVTQAFFNPICEIIDFLDSSAFKTHYTDRLYEQNVIDFILFIQAFQLIDNQKKNYYLSVRNYNKEKKYLFTLWDLDGSIGRLAGGSVAGTDSKQMAWGEKLGYHHLIHVFKTKKLRPDGFATKMNDRWQYLSTHELSLQNIRALMTKYADLFVSSGAWEREKTRWTPHYRNSVKIADTPQEEVDFMMAFLDTNYTIFNQKMASANWTHDPYDEARYAKSINPAIYVLGNDITSTHEDCTVTLQGSVHQESVAGMTAINYSTSQMTVTRDNGLHQYDIDSIKEVRTTGEGLYATPAFIPDSLRPYFDFDTRFAPVCETLTTTDTTFIVQRTVEVRFGDGLPILIGNLQGITASVEGDSVSLTTSLEGLALLVSGSSETGKISLNSQHPCKLAAAAEGAMLSSVSANCNLTVNTPFALNFYNDEFDGKCISTMGDVIIEDGNLYFLMTGSGTLTDASFQTNPTLGARCIMAQNITVNSGKICIKTLAHNGAVGLAAVRKVFINGGRLYIATYDDPIKTGSSVTVNGGFTFTTSLTNDGLDSKGDLFVNAGVLSTCGPEGAEAAFDVNHFYCTGGTVIGMGYKSDKPVKNSSSQAYLRLDKSTGVQRYIRITDDAGNELTVLETPAYPTTTILYSSSLLQKSATYSLYTSPLYTPSSSGTSGPSTSWQLLTTLPAE